MGLRTVPLPTATVGGGGTATIDVQPPNSRKWIVGQISVEVPGAPAGSTGDVRLNGRFISAFVTTGDSLGGDPPLPVRPVDTLRISVAGCTAGQSLQGMLIVDEVDDV